MALLLDRFSRVLRDDPDSPLVLSFAGRSWSAADLDEWAFGLVARCEALRVPAGSPIVTALGNRPEFIAVILAGLRSGRPILPADPGTTAAGILALARSFGAPLLVTRRSFMTGESTALPGGTRLSIAAGVEPQVCSDVGVMKLTSGSTGVPKAVLASPDNMAHDVEQIVSAMGIRDDDVQLGTIPLSHAYALETLCCRCCGRARAWRSGRGSCRSGCTRTSARAESACGRPCPSCSSTCWRSPARRCRPPSACSSRRARR